MALVTASTPTAVPQAGLVFDFLVGPWIEQLGPERYRLSPLLKDSGVAGIAAPLQRSIKTNVMNYLIQQRPFPADQLLQVFLIAFQQDDRVGLTWFGHAILARQPTRRDRSLSGWHRKCRCSPSLIVGDDKPLIPDDIPLSTLLRFRTATCCCGDRRYEAGGEACGSGPGRKQRMLMPNAAPIY